MPDVVVVGGSVGGLSVAVGLIKAGCNVVVLEKASNVVATTGAVSQPMEFVLFNSDILGVVGLCRDWRLTHAASAL